MPSYMSGKNIHLWQAERAARHPLSRCPAVTTAATALGKRTLSQGPLLYRTPTSYHLVTYITSCLHRIIDVWSWLARIQCIRGFALTYFSSIFNSHFLSECQSTGYFCDFKIQGLSRTFSRTMGYLKLACSPLFIPLFIYSSTGHMEMSNSFFRGQDVIPAIQPPAPKYWPQAHIMPTFRH